MEKPAAGKPSCSWREAVCLRSGEGALHEEVDKGEAAVCLSMILAAPHSMPHLAAVLPAAHARPCKWSLSLSAEP